MPTLFGIVCIEMRQHMRFVHIGDVHLGMSFKSASFGKEFGFSKRYAIKRNLQTVADHVRNGGIELMLIAGDLFESDYIELSDLHDVRYIFNTIPETDIVIMAGNHDPKNPGNDVSTLIDWPSHVHWMDSEYSCLELQQTGVSVVGVSWEDKGPMTFDAGRLSQEIEGAKGKFRIGMLHGDVYQSNEYFHMKPQELEALGLDYIALGHIHKPDFIRPNIAYSGSLEPLDFSECYDHGFIEGELEETEDGGVKGKFEFITSMIYPMELASVDITGCSSYLELLDRVRISLLKGKNLEDVKFADTSMVRLFLVGEKSLYLGDFDVRLEKELQEAFSEYFAYIEYKDNTVPGYDIDRLYEEHKDDLIGYYIREMEAGGLEEEVDRKALSIGITLLLDAMR